jgi:hypothetical protein
MIEDGFKPRNKSTDRNGRVIYDWGTTRKGLTSKIAKTIRELWPDEEEVTREYLGIVAKARAMMYFNGQVFPIDFESKEGLAMVGTTDLVVVEKEGITDVLLDAAKRYRIALVATGGETSKYAQDLIRLADEAGLNVCVLTDYDIHGIGIWRHAGTNIARIGIDRSIIKWLRDHGYRKIKDGTEITEEDVEEEYSPNPELLLEGDEPYLLTKRIELDAIVEKAGAHALWHYIVYKLEETFLEVRDYSPVISEPQPETFYTQEMNEFIEYLNNYIRGSYDEEWTKIKHDAEGVNGLTEVDQEEEANDIILKSVVQQDEGIKTISTKLKELMDLGTLPKAKQIQPIPDRKKPTKKKPEGVLSEEPKLKEGVRIHVDPEYDIFGVFEDENKTTQNLHADSMDKIDEKQEGGSKSTEETDSLESQNDNNESSFDYSALKEIKDAILKKYPQFSRGELKTMMNNFTLIVKSYRICKADLRMIAGGSPDKEFNKLFKAAKKAFEQTQRALSDVNINMDYEGMIDGKWIWGKIVDEK